MSSRCVALMVVFGLVCVALCAGVARAALTVEIVIPETDPYYLAKDEEQEFEAVAYVDGVELDGGQVSWEWDFDDETDHAYTNPVNHTFTEYGIYDVLVTATYGGQTATDDVIVIVSAAGTGGGGTWSPLPGWWLMDTRIASAGLVELSDGSLSGNPVTYSDSGPEWGEWGRALSELWGVHAETMVHWEASWVDVSARACSSVTVTQDLVKTDPQAPCIRGKYTAIVTWVTSSGDGVGVVDAEASGWADPPNWLSTGGVGAHVFSHEGWWCHTFTFSTTIGATSTVAHAGGSLPAVGSRRHQSTASIGQVIFEHLPQ